MKALYKFHFDCGINGKLNGLFIEEKEKVDDLIESGKIVYFGSVLGKDSEVMGPIEKSDLFLITTDEKILLITEHYSLNHGYNPFDYDILEKDDIKDDK